jgi:multimeric flavodoxin WrbA
MNVLILNGATENRNGAFHRTIRDALVRESANRGLTVTAFDLDSMEIKPCRGCFACWVKHPGTCAIRDDEERILEAVVRCDILVWLTPITFGGYSSALKKALDRIVPIALPFLVPIRGEVHHPPRYERGVKLLALGTLPRPDAEAETIFRGLVGRNAINLHPLRTRTTVLTEEMDEAAIGRAANEMLDQAEVTE